MDAPTGSNPTRTYKHYVFLSYSRKDSRAAVWLQRRLEWFRFPVNLVPQERRPPDSRFLRPIYRDRTSIDITDRPYWSHLEKSLEESQFLIVLCSPNSAVSKPVEKEVAHFLESHHNDSSYILPVILSGNISYQKNDGALGPTLRSLGEDLIQRTIPSFIPEPDQDEVDAWEAGFVEIVAYLLRIDRRVIGDHIQRETRRQSLMLRRWLLAVIVLAMFAASAGTIAWQQKSKAVDAEARTAEQLKETRRNLERSRFEEGNSWLERAYKAESHHSSFLAAMLAGRALGYRGYGWRSEDVKEHGNEIPSLLSEHILSDAKLEQERISRVSEAKRIIEGGANHHQGIVDLLTSNMLGFRSPETSTVCRLIWYTTLRQQFTDSVTNLCFLGLGGDLVASSSNHQTIRWNTLTGEQIETQKYAIEGGNRLSLSLDGDLMAAEATDHSVNIWGRIDGKHVLRLPGHGRTLANLCFDNNSKRLASASADGDIRVWDLGSGGHLALEVPDNYGEDHMASIPLIFAPNGTELAGGASHNIALWDAASGLLKATLRPDHEIVSALAYSRDGSRLVSGHTDNSLVLWDGITHQQLATMNSNGGTVWCLAFSPDGSKIASGSADGKIRLWNSTTVELIHTIDMHASAVRSLVFNADGTSLAGGSDGGVVGVWNVETGMPIVKVNGHQDEVLSVTFSRDTSLIASASKDGTIRLWDMTTGKEKASLDCPNSVPRSLAFSPDGLVLSSASDDGRIQLWDVLQTKEIASLNGHDSAANCIVYSPNGLYLASGGDDGAVRLWEVSRRTDFLLFSGNTKIKSVEFSPDGTCLAVGLADGSISLWDVVQGKEKFSIKANTLYGHKNSVCDIAFSADGKLIASASRDHTVKIWYASTGELIQTLPSTNYGVNCVSFSPDGVKVLGGTGIYESHGGFTIWNAVTGNELVTVDAHSGKIMGVAFSADGRRVVSGSVDGTIKVWDLAPREQISILKGHTSRIWGVSFSSDGQTVASGSEDKTVRVWDILSGIEIGSLQEHLDTVTCIAFSPDGKTLASGSSDESIKLWDMSTGSVLQTLEGHGGNVYCLSFSRDGNLLAGGYDDTAIRIWDVHSGKIVRKLGQRNTIVTKVAFGSDSLQLASLHAGNVHKLWDLQTGVELPWNPDFELAESEVVSSSGQMTASVDGNSIAIKAAGTIGADLFHLIRDGVVFFEKGELVWGMNHSLFQADSPAPIYPNNDELFELSASSDDSYRDLLHLRLFCKGNQWRAAVSFWHSLPTTATNAAAMRNLYITLLLSRARHLGEEEQFVELNELSIQIADVVNIDDLKRWPIKLGLCTWLNQLSKFKPINDKPAEGGAFLEVLQKAKQLHAAICDSVPEPEVASRLKDFFGLFAQERK